ncbi:probable splicing factor YJU2B [Schistocerca americana]|uniref:probable splicing factor YJU2B n=1 Tax=Schistocerca americana TaxID=7009 RepID=UPI001F500A59|nr:probable splicing factor YJU2B [Schistocerca americana]
MGERKGTNLYYPPDYDPKKGGLNKFLGTHALRERARKLHMGILIIRFEMPYNIWCDGCNNHIGMGVRYNAEKKKVGMYYSTPVYQFRMKCHLCDNHFEIKTDPANFDYVIVSGARRQENRWDPTQNEQVVPEDKATSKRLFDDAMFKLEHGDKDQKGAKSIMPTLSRLAAMREDRWQDDYSANCALRQTFRAKKHAQKKTEARDRALTHKFGLDLPLLPELESDVHLAKLLALKPAQSILERQSQSRQAIIERPVLPSSKTNDMRGLIKPLKRTHGSCDTKKHTSQILVKKREKGTIPQTVTLPEATVLTDRHLTREGETECNHTAETCSVSETGKTTSEVDVQGQKETLELTDENDCPSVLPADSVQQFDSCMNTKVVAPCPQENIMNVKQNLISNVPSAVTHISCSNASLSADEEMQAVTEASSAKQEVLRSSCSKSRVLNFTSSGKTWVKTFTSPICSSNIETSISTSHDNKSTSCHLKGTAGSVKEMAPVPVNRSSSCNPVAEQSFINKKRQTVCLVDSGYHGSTSSDSDDHVSS